MGALGPALGAVVVVLLALLSILWIILPFAVFGIKGRMDKISAQLDVIQRQLANRK